MLAISASVTIQLSLIIRLLIKSILTIHCRILLSVWTDRMEEMSLAIIIHIMVYLMRTQLPLVAVNTVLALMRVLRQVQWDLRAHRQLLIIQHRQVIGQQNDKIRNQAHLASLGHRVYLERGIGILHLSTIQSMNLIRILPVSIA